VTTLLFLEFGRQVVALGQDFFLRKTRTPKSTGRRWLVLLLTLTNYRGFLVVFSVLPVAQHFGEAAADHFGRKLPIPDNLALDDWIEQTKLAAWR
jgi:hypothetical protein